jgi:uncharacterized protein YukE
VSEKSIDNFEYVPADQCFAAKHTTPFGLNYDMDQMKDMVRNADPATVKSVSEAWADLSKDLVGGGGIKETLETAVQHVLSHWEGASADLFRERAQVISQKITDSAKYADNTSQSLKGAAVVLDKIKDEVLAMEKPSGLSSAMDWAGDLGDRDASGADNALKNGASADDARNDNEGSLSAGREAQLKMAAKMEILGAAYNSRAAEMGSWRKGRGVGEGEDYPGDPGGIPPAAVVVPTGSVRSPQGATGGTVRAGQTGTISPSKSVAPPAGITGGAHKPSPTPQPQVGTAIDGVAGGRVETPTVGGPGTVNGGSANASAPTGGGPVGGALGGSAKSGVGGIRGGVGGRSGGAGVASRGSASAAGRAGAGAGAGMAKGGAARAGGLARQSGGVVGGTPRAGAGAGAGGRGTAGGTGLHRSRGAAGGAGAVRKGGTAGMPGGRPGRPKDEERRENERPDYLVEDEETWTPQTNAAPRVIE